MCRPKSGGLGCPKVSLALSQGPQEQARGEFPISVPVARGRDPPTGNWAGNAETGWVCCPQRVVQGCTLHDTRPLNSMSLSAATTTRDPEGAGARVAACPREDGGSRVGLWEVRALG